MATGNMPYAIVTMYLLDWPGDLPSLLALKVPMDEVDIDSGFSYPNKGALERLAASEIEKIDFNLSCTPGGGWPAWEYRGIRWNMSENQDRPDLLPGEHWMPNGAADVNALLTRYREREEAEEAAIPIGP